jgi:peptide-methionine (S)-S-oxide reductase
VGYTGGTTAYPTYHNLGDHTETIEVDYDPAIVSYADLLNVFWSSHDPTRRPWSKQYMSAIFYHNKEQEKLANETRDLEAAKSGGRIYTEILPAATFFRAEDYHQKYYLRRRSALVRELRGVYGGEEEFENSKIAARLNGYFAGYGTLADIQKEMADMGLSEKESLRILSELRQSNR